jgi:hypothetical protein
MIRLPKARAFAPAGTFVLVGLIAGQLNAQPNQTPSAASAPTPAAATPGDARSQADAIMIKMTGAAQQVQAAQARAHRENDVIKLNCVNDSLLVVKQSLNAGAATQARLDAAVAANDTAGQSAAMADLANIATAVDQSKQSADGCLGSGQITETAGNVTIEHPVIRDNPTSDCNNLGSINCVVQPLEYVAFASPFTPN